MTTRQNDTVPDAEPATGAGGEGAPSSDRSTESQQGTSADVAPRVSDSEVERMDRVLRDLAKRPLRVPNSFEPGSSYQAQHAPAAARGEEGAQPAVLIAIPPDSRPPGSTDSRTRTTVPGGRSTARRGALVVALAIGALALGALVVLSIRASNSEQTAPVRAPLTEVPALTSGVTASPLASGSPMSVDKGPREARSAPEETQAPQAIVAEPSATTRIAGSLHAKSPRHPTAESAASSVAPVASSGPSPSSSAKPMPYFDLLKETP